MSRIAKGVVLRTGDELTWQGVVYALEKLLELNVWLGGKTALQLKGLTHYLAIKKTPTVLLYSSTVSRLPKWVAEQKKLAEFQLKSSNLFSDQMPSASVKKSFSEYSAEKLTLTVSSPERAILELLDDVPSKQTFAEAQLIFESLSTLRPSLVKSLLENCKSVKVKRLFLYFADECGHAWFKKLDLSKIDLGKGKRAITQTGRLNKKYQILIPKES